MIEATTYIPSISIKGDGSRILKYYKISGFSRPRSLLECYRLFEKFCEQNGFKPRIRLVLMAELSDRFLRGAPLLAHSCLLTMWIVYLMKIIGFMSVISIMVCLHFLAIAIVSQQGRVSKLSFDCQLMRSMASNSVGFLETSDTKNRCKLWCVERFYSIGWINMHFSHLPF